MPDSTVLLHWKKTPLNFQNALKKEVLNIQKTGYLLAYADSVSKNEIRIHKGPFYDSIDIKWSDANGIKNIRLPATEYSVLAENWITEKENTGYPFAQVKLVSLSQENDKPLFKAIAEEGSFFKYDSIAFAGTEISARFMKWTSGIVRGQPYDHRKSMIFLSRMSSVEGFYAGEFPKLYVVDQLDILQFPLRRAGRDQLNGLIGLATVPGGRPLITGELSGKFFNMFHAGVAASIEWKSFKARSQELRINASVPYFLGVPFVSRLQLYYEKFDTLYSAFTRGLSIKLPAGKHLGFTIGATFTDRYRIYSDISSVSIYRALPSNPPSRNSLYQLGLEYSNLIIGAMPHKGLELTINAGAGTRRFVNDPEIASVTWLNSKGQTENIYDSLKRIGQYHAARYRLKAEGNYYFPVKKWLVIRAGGLISYYQAKTVYFNELERFGGIKNLRGFTEQSIFANEFYMSTLELRFVSGQSGYVGPFWHLGWYKDASGHANPGRGVVQGAGIQAAFKTAAGIMNLAWAVGKSGDLPFSLNQSRFHAGLSATF